ncbi:MAG: phosphoglycerate dehydrogenase [Crocinitomicaceae bacterium]|nr:phosphoglycerate dehydrogenase [Crocinitomicaceae bacterium]
MKVAFLDTVHPILQERLETQEWECYDYSNTPMEKLIYLINDFDGIVIRSRFRMEESFLRHANNIKFIARSGAGMENIDEAYCQKRKITLFNAPEGNRGAVAEHALGMLLTLFNKIIKGNQEVRAGIWDREGNRGIELEGKTVGIIGYGNNGSEFAKKLRGFDCEILAYDKYKSGFGTEFVKESSPEEIQEKAHVLSLHIPQTEETIGLINRDYISKFKKSFYLINLSRGKNVITDDLVKALQEGKILGACLDVLEYEKSSFENMFTESMPAAFEYLIHADNVVLSPHVGGWTQESYFKLSNILADKILKEFS